MISRTTAVKLLVAQGIIFMFLLGGGLQLIKHQLQTDAQALAVRVNNAQTCAFRELVDTPIAGYRRSIAIQQAIVDDPKRSKKVHDTAAANVVAINKTLSGLVKFRNVYITVPADYKCPATKETP